MLRILATCLVLAAPATPASCTPTPKACDLSFAGITVEAHTDRVVDTVNVVCDRKHAKHYIEVTMQYKTFDTWDVYGRTVVTSRIPGEAGLVRTVSSPCRRGWYRARACVEGRGPATEQRPDGIPFVFEDYGRAKYVTAEDCAGGG